jgi:formylglycine-generating enzyme
MADKQHDSGGRLVGLLFGIALAAGSIGLAWKLVRRAPLPTASLPASREPEPELDRMVLVPDGRFLMGNELSRSAAEHPQHEVRVDSFWLDAHEVTVAEFAEFVAATGYISTAQRKGRAWVFEPARKKWALTSGADWQHPLGPHSSNVGRERLPVVQVSWQDASAYAAWAGKRLPTEAEWEYAARGGLYDADFPWGREEKPDEDYQANYWQGWFPDQDLGRDGFRSLAPVRSYPANRFGLYDMAGNVWEWCADWYSADYYQLTPPVNPTGPKQGSRRVQRGGSWLCAENASAGLRVWTRSSAAPDACHNHVGFRCARDLR